MSIKLERIEHMMEIDTLLEDVRIQFTPNYIVLINGDRSVIVDANKENYFERSLDTPLFLVY